MTVREASRDDIRNLAILATKTYIDAFGHSFSPEELQERIEKTRSEKYFEAAFGRDVILVAEEGGELIGYTEFGPVDLPIEGLLEGDMELVRLYVNAAHQRRGIGSTLIEAALSYPEMRAAKHIYLDVWEKSEGVIRLYKSFGFTETGKVVDGDTIMVRDGQQNGHM